MIFQLLTRERLKVERLTLQLESSRHFWRLNFKYSHLNDIPLEKGTDLYTKGLTRSKTFMNETLMQRSGTMNDCSAERLEAFDREPSKALERKVYYTFVSILQNRRMISSLKKDAL